MQLRTHIFHFPPINITVIYKGLAGVPGVARDEKLRKQIF